MTKYQYIEIFHIERLLKLKKNIYQSKKNKSEIFTFAKGN